MSGREDERPAAGTGEAGASGDDTERVIREVLEDQARRKKRRDEASTPNGGKGLLPLPVVALLWGVLCLVVWVATPSFLLPEPIPEPETAQVEAGLRMQMLALASDIDRFQDEAGQVPRRLDEVTSEPPWGVEYVRLSSSTYRLVGIRGETEIVYQSGTPTEEFLGQARREIRGGGGEDP